MLNLEILSPAGSSESLFSALNSGADAVYLGAKSFSARKNAANFNNDELKEAVRLCRLYNVKIYLTLNTLIFDNEIKEVKLLLDFAEQIGINAVILQDLTVLQYINEQGYKLGVHASTQISINSLSGAIAAKKLGFSRVVLARELSLAEIKKITSGCDIETEVFVHGALCVSVSGQCYMSAMFGGRSGNRGLCAQPCRLEFSSENNKNALSLKDLSLITDMPVLAKAGVTSVKIEGRMKRPEYVYAVTNACYKMKNGIMPSDDEFETINSIFSRNGFTKGYFNANFLNMSGVRTKENLNDSKAAINKLRDLHKQPIKKRILNIKLIIKAGEPVKCIVKSDNHEVNIKFDPPEKSLNKQITSEQIKKQLQKLGGTIFETGDIICELDDGLFLSLSAINGIRRKITEVISESLNNNLCNY